MDYSLGMMPSPAMNSPAIGEDYDSLGIPRGCIMPAIACALPQQHSTFSRVSEQGMGEGSQPMEEDRGWDLSKGNQKGQRKGCGVRV